MYFKPITDVRIFWATSKKLSHFYFHICLHWSRYPKFLAHFYTACTSVQKELTGFGTLLTTSVTSKKSPNIYKSCPKLISLEKWKILTPFQKLPKNVGRFGQINCCQSLWNVAQSPINRPIWSHCWWHRPSVSVAANFSINISKNSLVLLATIYLEVAEAALTFLKDNDVIADSFFT